MKCLLLSVPLVLCLISTDAAIAQVRVNVPGHSFKAQEDIRASVMNTGTGAITVCLVFTSMDRLPLPFAAQKYNNGTWGTLLNGVDLGPNGSALVLGAGESQEFTFRLSEPGKMRPLLEYWHRSLPNLNCNDLPKGSKVTTSKTFTVE